MPKKTAKTGSSLGNALAASRSAFVSVGVFSFCINLLMLTMPLYMLQVYDRVLTSRSFDTLIMLSILALGLMSMNGLLEFVRARVLVRVGARLDQTLSPRIFGSVVAQRLRGGDEQGQPLRDLETLRTFLTGSALLAFYDSPWTPLFIGLIFIFHPWLGAIALIGAILLFSLALLGEFLTRRPLAEASLQSMRANRFAESTFRNAEAIEAMGMRPALEERWLERHVTALAYQAHASDRSGSLTATVKFVRPVLQMSMLGFGAYLAIQQIITPGVMIAASIILGRALAPVEAAINGWRSFVGARGAHGRLSDLLGEAEDATPDMALPAPSGRLAVEVGSAGPPGLTKPVLRRINLALEPGEALGVIGPSAAGKSSLARLLVGVWKPQSGHVRLDGADVYDWNPVELGPHVGYLPQDVELFDGSVADNIARFTEADPAAVVAAAQRAGVHEMILQLPDGYDTIIGESGGVLSGGQRQRIALARALFGPPALVVLDEPNSNLDSEGEAALHEAIAWLKSEGRTVVIISHRPNILNQVDKILLLREGRIEELGPAQEILAKLTRPVAARPKPASKVALVGGAGS